MNNTTLYFFVGFLQKKCQTGKGSPLGLISNNFSQFLGKLLFYVEDAAQFWKHIKFTLDLNSKNYQFNPNSIKIQNPPTLFQV